MIVIPASLELLRVHILQVQRGKAKARFRGIKVAEKDLHNIAWDMMTQGKTGKIQIVGKDGSRFVSGSIELFNGGVISIRCGDAIATEAAKSISRLAVERIQFMATSPTNEKQADVPDGADLLFIISEFSPQSNLSFAA